MSSSKTLLIALCILSLLGCASSRNGNGRVTPTQADFDVHSPMLAPWGADKLTVMKAAQKRNLSHLDTRETGDTTVITFVNKHYWYTQLMLIDGKYFAYRIMSNDGREYLTNQYDLLIKVADDLDRQNRLLIKTLNGTIAIGKGYEVYGGYGQYHLTFTNISIPQ